jgi:hypothetical protein
LREFGLRPGTPRRPGFKPIVSRHAVGATPASYAQQGLVNSIALLSWITATDGLIAEWASRASIAGRKSQLRRRRVRLPKGRKPHPEQRRKVESKGWNNTAIER